MERCRSGQEKSKNRPRKRLAGRFHGSRLKIDYKVDGTLGRPICATQEFTANMCKLIPSWTPKHCGIVLRCTNLLLVGNKKKTQKCTPCVSTGQTKSFQTPEIE